MMGSIKPCLAELEDLDGFLLVVPDEEGIETFGLFVAGQFNALFISARS